MDPELCQINIKGIELGDFESVVRIHRAAFPRNALSRLGRGSVRRYYLWQLTGPHAVTSLLARVGNVPAGFLVGGIFQGALSGFLWKNKLFLMSRLLGKPWLVADWRFRKSIKVAYGIGLRFLNRLSPEHPVIKQSKTHQFTVLVVAVHPSFQRYGVGKQLMRNAEQCARDGGWAEVHLTVEPQNDRAIQFYEGLGYLRIFNNGEWRGRMMKILE